MNYYKILKVTKNASDEQIKSSYKKLVKQYHPDLYVGDKDFAEQKIKEINEAYDILSNPEKKLEYDEYLNLTTNPIQSYSPSPGNVETNIKNETPSTSSFSRIQSSFHKWIMEHFNRLDTKQQLQIFIVIFILVLSLFLVNLIQVQYYINHPNTVKDLSENTNTNSISNTTQNIDTGFIENEFDNYNLYTQEDLKNLDNLFYDLFKTYDYDHPEYQNSF